MPSTTKSPTRRQKNSPFRRPRKAADKTLKRAAVFDKTYFTEENYKYEEWHSDQGEKIVKEINRHLHPKKHWTFLDVGCALGGVVQALRRRGYEAYGVDLSHWCIKNSPTKNYLHHGSVTNLPCADDSVDVTVCIDTFQYLTRDEAKNAIKELRRVTQKYLCFESITWEDTQFSDPKENPDTVRKHTSLFTQEELLELFEDAGFKVKKKRFLPRHIEGKAKPSAEDDDYLEYYEYDFSFNAIFEVLTD